MKTWRTLRKNLSVLCVKYLPYTSNQTENDSSAFLSIPRRKNKPIKDVQAVTIKKERVKAIEVVSSTFKYFVPHNKTTASRKPTPPMVIGNTLATEATINKAR